MKFAFYHGAVLVRIIHDNVFDSIKSFSDNNSSYIVNKNIGLYIKYSGKRMSPWTFTFSDVHIDEIKELDSKFNKAFVVFVCNENGICCLNFQEFSTIISLENKIFTKWIKLSRTKREKYSIAGSDNKLNCKIADSDFPKKIYV
jgi:hypothetical protein